MVRRIGKALVYLAAAMASVPPTSGGDFAWGGSVRSYLYVFDPAAVRAGGTAVGPSPEAVATGRVRLEAAWSPDARVRLEGAYDLAPRFESGGFAGGSLLPGRPDPLAYRAFDLDPAAAASGRFTLGQNLDRASVRWRFPAADLTFGRQAVAWGSARGVNPTDVLAPFAFEVLDAEDRIGIDAVRARIPAGLLGEIDAGYVFGRDLEFRNSAFFLRAASNVRRTDLSVMVVGFRENLLLGFDLARSIGGAGYWLEAAAVAGGALGGGGGGRDYVRASTGLDYNLSGSLYGFVEYHYNGAGAAGTPGYAGRLAETAYREGAVYLAGRHYCIPGALYQYSPLVSLTVQALVNVTDPSVFLAPRAEYNIAPDVYLGAGAFVGIGRSPVAKDPASPPVLRSEFGGYPGIYFASLRTYF